MSDVSTAKNNDLGVIVGGVVALLIVGMLTIAVVSTTAPDSTAALASIGGLMTMGAAGIFGLAKMRSEVVRTAEAVATTLVASNEVQAEKMQENTALTRRVSHQLNGGLDERMKRIAKEAMTEVMEEWTRPRTP
jgi:predicted ThiF/HesA family dinucleotide-utilizing enzyme